MQINKNGFYIVSQLFQDSPGDTEIVIADNLEVALFDDTNTHKIVRIGEKVICDYFAFFHDSASFFTHILCQKDGSKVSVNTLIFGHYNHISSKILGEMDANNIVLNMNILSFAGEGANVGVDGILQVNAGTYGCIGRLEEENIFLGENASISGFPTLLVATNDVQASHACKMEKISDESLFYLRSRGIGRENALNMILESKIVNLYSSLQRSAPEFYEKLITDVLAET